MKSLLALLGLALGLVVADAASAQVQNIPSCTVASNANCGVNASTNVIYRATDSNAVNSCAAGGGANEVICLCEGVTCVPLVDDAGADALPGTTAGTFTIDSDGAPGAAILDTAGAGTITIGSGDVTNVTIDSDAGVTFQPNSDSINNTADDVFDFTRDDTGVVTLTCSDDDATADCTYDAGGAAQVTVGSADVTSVRLSTANEVRIVNGATGNVFQSFRDFADTTDDDQAHGQIVVNCTDTGSGTEDCDMNLQVTTAGAAPATVVAIDADGNAAGASAAVIVPMRAGADPPATCSVGELFIDIDTATDTNCVTAANNAICICNPANTWVVNEP